MGARPRRAARVTRRARTPAVVVAALALIAGPGVAASALPVVHAEIDIPTTDAVQPADCPVDVPGAFEDRVMCGVLTVAERRDAAADPERVIELPFAVVAAAAEQPSPAPLIFPTSGGPGGGSLSSLRSLLEDAPWMSADRDLIVIEQRGDALSNPTLDCPELDADAFIADGRQVSGDAYSDARAAGVTGCRDRLVADGVDLSAYTSAASAADLADLRTALEYDLWNLYGLSYGARVALTAMRDQPAGLRAVVLDGAFPPNVDSDELHPAGFVGAVDALSAACEADARCRAAYPDVKAQLVRVLERAASDPFEVTVRSPADGSRVTVEYDDRDLAYRFFNALYDAGSIGVLPFVIDRLDQGDTGALRPLAQQRIDAAGRLSEGLGLSVQCAEEIPFESAEEIDAAYSTEPLTERLRRDVPVSADCEIWGVPALGEVENAAVASGIPTLLAVGGFDPVTPLSFSEAAAAGLSNHRLYTFPTASHGVVWSSQQDTCAASIAQQFLTDPLTEPDAGCLDRAEPIAFVTPGDARATPAVYGLAVDLVQLREPVQVGFAVASVLVFLGTLIYAAVYGVLRSARRVDEAAPGTVLAATTTAGFFLAFIAAFVLVLATTNQLVLAVGIPPAAWLISLLAMVALAVAVLLVVLLVRAWRRDDGALAHRVVFSITAVFGIAFGVWLLVRGLLLF